MCRLGVRCSPVITDPSEFSTILLLSIRSLFGELESHSIGLNISSSSNNTDNSNTQEEEQQHQQQDNNNKNNNNNNNYHFRVECHNKSIDTIRASLTMVTAPSYLQSKIYRFDIINVE
jgi:predicted alpha/beta superfamily hydrolase